jgi:hypothetical protein
MVSVFLQEKISETGAEKNQFFMNRRKAISRLVLTGVGGGILLTGYKWYDWNKSPDIVYLEGHRELITTLAETIIPATDVPGAKEAAAGDFIIIMVRDCTDRMSMNKFIDGLKDLEQHCQNSYNKSYKQCTEAQQQAVMSLFEEKGSSFRGVIGKVQNRYLGQSFFATLKKYSVLAYCSSEAGATRGLAYYPVPGSFNGCMIMSQGQRTWATR